MGLTGLTVHTVAAQLARIDALHAAVGAIRASCTPAPSPLGRGWGPSGAWAPAGPCCGAKKLLIFLMLLVTFFTFSQSSDRLLSLAHGFAASSKICARVVSCARRLSASAATHSHTRAPPRLALPPLAYGPAHTETTGF